MTSPKEDRTCQLYFLKVASSTKPLRARRYVSSLQDDDQRVYAAAAPSDVHVFIQFDRARVVPEHHQRDAVQRELLEPVAHNPARCLLRSALVSATFRSLFGVPAAVPCRIRGPTSVPLSNVLSARMRATRGAHLIRCQTRRRGGPLDRESARGTRAPQNGHRRCGHPRCPRATLSPRARIGAVPHFEEGRRACESSVRTRLLAERRVPARCVERAGRPAVPLSAR
jgi:hypothetical protein